MQKKWLFCDVFKTSQKHLKKHVFCATSLRCLEHISKKMSFLWCLWDVSKTSLACICEISKIPHKNNFDFCRVITICDKIDVGPLETLKKWNIFWEQCVDISGLISAWEFWQVSDRQSPVVGVLFTTFSDIFRLVELYIACCHYELCWNTET